MPTCPPFQITSAHGGFTSSQRVWLCNSTADTAGTATNLSHPLNSEDPRGPEAGGGQGPEHELLSAGPVAPNPQEACWLYVQIIFIF